MVVKKQKIMIYIARQLLAVFAIIIVALTTLQANAIAVGTVKAKPYANAVEYLKKQNCNAAKKTHLLHGQELQINQAKKLLESCQNESIPQEHIQKAAKIMGVTYP